MQDDQRDPTAEAPGHAVGSPLVTFYRPPRLGIIHLLAWMAVTAVLMSLTMSIRSLERKGDSQIHDAWVMSEGLAHSVWTMQTIMLAAVLVGMFVLVRDRRRGAKGCLQPGHWVLIAERARGSCSTLCSFSQEITFTWLYPPDAPLSDGLYFLVCALPQLLQHALVA